MKKILFALALLVSISTYAKWGANCTSNGGTIIKANEYGTKDGVNLDKGGLCNDPNNPDLTNNCNGMEFCMSGKNMNWWSAFTWCESIGGQLASFEHICPGSQLVSNWDNKNACPNFKKAVNVNGWIWTPVGSSFNDRAYFVDVGGAVYDGGGFLDNKRNGTKGRALCEEK